MTDKPVPDLAVSDLMLLWTESTQCDKATFAEMRTNLQIVAGQHYLSEGSSYWNRIRDNKQLSDAQRLKLVKNHTQRVTTIYRNAIEEVSSDCGFEPANPNELGDQKAAQLNDSYWQYIKRCEDFDRKRSIWAKNFVETGEFWVKIFWSMDGGQVVGYEAEMEPHPETGEPTPVQDEQGNYVQSNRPSYGGKVKIETLEAYRVKRDKDATSFAESPYLFVDKLIPIKTLRATFKDEKVIKALEASKPNQGMVIYDSNSKAYKTSTDQVIIRECYWRPSPAIPNGYFQYFTDTVILAQGELPYGIFPLVGETFEDQTGNPRGYGPVRAIRPAQVEINRCASKIAEHQITLGDDKVWVGANTKLNQGATLPGIRVNTFSGQAQAPTVTQGRSGEQYVPYLESQIKELYTLANLPEVNEDQPDSPDLYANLLRSYRFKKKFAVYGSRFERGILAVAETCLNIAKSSCSDEELIPAIGKSEYINIPEFKSSEPLHYRIKIKARSGDIESQFGQQISINHVLQYVGQNLGKDEIGKMIRLSPFLNAEQMFSDMTSKYDSLVNDILAMDRGQMRPPRKYDDHKYIIEGLSNRCSKPDFEFLPPQIQQLYAMKIQAHEQAQAQTMQEIKRMESEFIPSGGYAVKCDFYVPDPSKPQGSTKRLALPSESISWLLDRLAKQGSEMDGIERLPGGAQAELGNMVSAGAQPAPDPRQMMRGFSNA